MANFKTERMIYEEFNFKNERMINEEFNFKNVRMINEEINFKNAKMIYEEFNFENVRMIYEEFNFKNVRMIYEEFYARFSFSLVRINKWPLTAIIDFDLTIETFLQGDCFLFLKDRKILNRRS